MSLLFLSRSGVASAVTCTRIFSQTAGQGSGLKGLLNTFGFSLSVRHPPLFNPSLSKKESLNQGPAVFSTRIMHRRKTGWTANLQGTGAHVTFGSHWVIA